MGSLQSALLGFVLFKLLQNMGHLGVYFQGFTVRLDLDLDAGHVLGKFELT